MSQIQLPYSYARLSAHVSTWERFAKGRTPFEGSILHQALDEHVSTDDYVHAQKVWEIFGVLQSGELL